MPPVDLSLRLQTAPANLLRASVPGQDRAVYVPLFGEGRPDAGPQLTPGELLWSDGVVSAYLVQARREEAGFVIDLRVVTEQPRPLAASASAAA
jgi:hypothetical protein